MRCDCLLARSLAIWQKTLNRMTFGYQDALGSLMSNMLTHGAQVPVLMLESGSSVSVFSVSRVRGVQTNSEYVVDIFALFYLIYHVS